MLDQNEPKGARRQLLIEKLRDRSGAAIALVALSMVALLAAVALAVDVGMMVTARTEQQRLGDAAAHQGAIVLRDTGGDSAAAHNSTVAWGSTNNTVRGENVPILEEDVDVIPDDWTVRVRVHRNDARGNALPTFFARIFGVDEVNINTVSAAWAAPSSSAGGEGSECLLPVALVDDFVDNNDNGIYDAGDGYDPDGNPQIGGYDENDHGRLIKLKIHSNNEETGPPACQTDPTNPDVYNEIDYCQDGGDSSAWRCWWREIDPAGGGTDVLGPWIYPGENCPSMSVGDTVYAASGSGNKQSLVTNDDNDHHFEALINSDPDLAWDGNKECVVDANGDCFTGSSYRIREAPVVNPTIDAGGSHTYSVIEDLIGVFVERVACAYDAGPSGGPEGRWNVYVRLLVGGGSGAAGTGGDDESSLVRTIQIIE